ncbi:MAG: hypothetical protein AAF490_06670 [Chloroflexota bacterium]
MEFNTKLTLFRTFSIHGLLTLLRQRPIQYLIGGWLLLNTLLLVLGANGMPVSLVEGDGTAHVFLFLSTGLAYLLQLALVYAITTRREGPDFTIKTPDRKTAVQETVYLWIYALIMLIVLGGGFGIGLHLPGTIFDPNMVLNSNSIIVWAGVNFTIFAAIPYLIFRRRGYTHDDMLLRSRNWWADLLLIAVVLIIESLIEWFGIPDGMRFFALTPTQMGLGGLLNLFLHLLGTGLPILIFVQAILVPRYYKISGSLAGAVVAGGITYATFHLFEFWTVYQSLETTAVSLVFVYLQFTGAGMIKAMMTLRSGNAWTHLWGYHLIAPHLWTDTNIFVQAFRIR